MTAWSAIRRFSYPVQNLTRVRGGPVSMKLSLLILLQYWKIVVMAWSGKKLFVEIVAPT